MNRILLAVPVGLAAAALVVTATWADDLGSLDRSADVAAIAPTVVTSTPAPSGSDRAPEVPSGPPQASVAWVDATAVKTGIEARALLAYANASLRMAQEQPSCRLGWTALAGIGQVETGHGQGRLDADGRSVEIHGPELDGTDGNAAISEDGTWDRARGPMQFIASTWRDWAADGDGDGVADVDDVDDAAYAAARYLCASGADLTTPAGWTRAVHSYNHSDEYVQAVLGAANTYAARSR